MRQITALILGALISAPVAFSQGVLEKVLKGKGQVIDLTHKLSPSIPYWPGATYKPFQFETIATLEKDGVYSGAFCMAEHTGTHVDAPNHFEAGQASVDALDLRQLIALAVVIDVREQVAKNPDYRLTVDDLKRWEKRNGAIPSKAVVFMYTGWESRWNDINAYRNQDENKVMHFPGFSTEAAQLLVSERSINGIGIDTLSVDYGPSKDFRVHHIMNRAGKYHVENAANLSQLPAKGAIVVVAAIPIQNGSGAPARVFALVP
jgi:kynurenine formamidase